VRLRLSGRRADVGLWSTARRDRPRLSSRTRFDSATLDFAGAPSVTAGLKVNPVTGMVWALQNQDGNSTLSLINPTTNTVSSPLSYASPPYVYGPSSARGYDDLAFLGGKVYLSYTNPVNPTDPVAGPQQRATTQRER
jgi:hypothetical protein